MTRSTLPRAARVTALLMAKQSAKGTVVTDFTANTARLWTAGEDIDASLVFNEPRGNHYMSAPLSVGTDACRDTGRGPSGSMIVHATPESVEYVLRSNWGAFAAGAFTLGSQVGEWFTMAFVEDVGGVGTSTARLLRLRDAFLGEIAFDIDALGMVEIEAQFEARERLDTGLDSLGGVTLPASPMLPADTSVFTGRSATLVRDPSGDNETIPFGGIRISLGQNPEAEWTMSDGWQVSKSGKAVARLEVRDVGDEELWNIRDAVNAGTKQDYRIRTTADDGTVLQFYLHDVMPIVENLGRAGKSMRPGGFRAYAHRDSGGSFVDITMS